ncbi:MAG: hypothetical protein R3345_01665 [Fulvivirga sp.]|nr:hypothetical protein [Fulvivirga sp.]
MKTISLFILCSFLLACGGSLSDEQRKALKEEMEAREIKKVKEEDIVARSFELGKAIYQNHINNSDSLVKALNATILWLEPTDSGGGDLEKQLLEAYVYSFEQGEKLSHNVQRDSEVMLYTMPVVSEESFEGIYVIRIPRKEVVLNL